MNSRENVEDIQVHTPRPLRKKSSSEGINIEEAHAQRPDFNLKRKNASTEKKDVSKQPQVNPDISQGPSEMEDAINNIVNKDTPTRENTPDEVEEPKYNVPEDSTGDHPFIVQLRREFGIENIPTKDSGSIAGRTFTFRRSDARDIVFAKNMANLTTVFDPQHVIDFATVCICTCAMNKVPIYLLYNVSVGKDNISNPLYPPPRIRISASQSLFDDLMGMDKDLRNTLVAAYKEEFPRSIVYSYLDAKKSMKRDFICTTAECEYTFRDIPMVVKGKSIPFYCKYHATEMEIVPEQNHPLL